MASTHKESYITSQTFNILCNQDSISLGLLNNIVNILENCLFVANEGIEPSSTA